MIPWITYIDKWVQRLLTEEEGNVWYYELPCIKLFCSVRIPLITKVDKGSHGIPTERENTIFPFMKGCHDTKHNDIKHNNTQHNN